jgi:carbonic anhydrase/acetyltransferase-like protein (isoleucine patch superfamily)
MNRSSNTKELEDRVRKNLEIGPTIPQNAFIASGVRISGKVVLGEFTSVWHNAVLRGDIEAVIVGKNTNIQDNVVLHTADGLPCCIGDGCTVGHSAIIHACTIGDECLIGMGAIILDGSEIGPRCIIGAASVVTKNTKIAEGSLVYGTPAKFIRKLTSEEISSLRISAERYVKLAQLHREQRDVKAI